MESKNFGGRFFLNYIEMRKFGLISFTLDIDSKPK